MSDDVLVKVSKVSEKGMVQLPVEVRDMLGLTPGTRMVVMTTEDAVVLRKAEFLLSREPPASLLSKIRSIFAKVPIRDIEE